MPSAAGARRKHSGFNSPAANTKTNAETVTKPQVKPRESMPAGRWRMRVRGLRASIPWSIRRLKAIAAERAPTIATTIQPIFVQAAAAPRPEWRKASRAPVSAKGKAKTECSNLIISRVSRMRFHICSKRATILSHALFSATTPAGIHLRRLRRSGDRGSRNAGDADHHAAQRPEDPRRSGDERRGYPERHDVSRFTRTRPRHALHPPDTGTVQVLDVPVPDFAGHRLDGHRPSHRGNLTRYAAVQDEGQPVSELRRQSDRAIRAGAGRRGGAALRAGVGPNAAILDSGTGLPACPRGPVLQVVEKTTVTEGATASGAKAWLKPRAGYPVRPHCHS